MAAAKPNSMFGGVQIGADEPYGGLPNNAEALLKAVVECGLNAIELLSGPEQAYAGGPASGRGGMGGGAPGGAAGGAARAGAPGAQGAAAGGAPGGPGGAPGAPGAAGAQGRGAGGARAPLTPEQQAVQAKAQAELRQWRETVSMDKFKAFRKMYNDAGVKIYAFKLAPTLTMSDGEFKFIWDVGETLGANHLTMELPAQLNQQGELVWNDELLKRVAAYATKRKFRMAFHAHGQGGEKGFQKALDASPYLALNIDVGHFFGVNGISPLPVVEKYADMGRIASLHLKDRAAPPPGTEETAAAGPGRGGPNMPWGQGGTPIIEILQLMKRKKYKFPAAVELEYRVPEGSTAIAETKKCVEYCRKALA
jgi:sugar phosphate isomerase/epimerase